MNNMGAVVTSSNCIFVSKNIYGDAQLFSEGRKEIFELFSDADYFLLGCKHFSVGQGSLASKSVNEQYVTEFEISEKNDLCVFSRAVMDYRIAMDIYWTFSVE